MATKPFFLIGCLLLVWLLVGTVSADTLSVQPKLVASSGTDALRNQTWATLQGGNGDNTWNTAPITEIYSDLTTNTWRAIKRFGGSFNTSDLPDDAIISNVSFTFKTHATTAKVDNFGGNIDLVQFNPANPAQTSAAQSDYQTYQTDLIAPAVTISTLSTNTAYTIYLTNFTPINKTGYTNLGFRVSWDRTNSEPSWQSNKHESVTFSGTESVYFLNITYSLPDTTPPASVTSLAASNTTCTELNLTYTKPADADFNHTMIYQDNVLHINESNTTNFHTFTGLTGGQSYTFSTKTVDTTGNVNTTWVNVTESATSCGSAPVSSFTIQKSLYRIPGILQANDTSTNTPTLWNWSWGDGTWTNGTTQNATHKYTTRGLKSILLVTSNANGANTTPTASTVRIVGYENYW